MLMIFPRKYLISVKLNLYTDEIIIIIIIVFRMVKLLGPTKINEDKKINLFCNRARDYEILSCIFYITSALRIIILLSKVQWV